MKALTKEEPLDDEGLLTLICEVEAIINGVVANCPHSAKENMDPYTSGYSLRWHPQSILLRRHQWD